MFIAVDTPPSPSGDAHTRFAVIAMRWAAAAGHEEHPRPFGLVRRVMAVSGCTRRFYGITYASNPEFLREGAAIQELPGADRIVIGLQDRAAVEALYRGIDTDIVHTSVPTAEMVKYASNAFLLATKISFINEISANVCEQVGADVRTVARGTGPGPHRIGPHFLQAGIGYGALASPRTCRRSSSSRATRGYHFQLLNAVIEVNALQEAPRGRETKERLGTLRGDTVALLGLTFKPNTDDLREAASIALAGRLIHEGAEVRAYDPMLDAGEHPLFPGVCGGAAGGSQRRRRRRARHWNPAAPAPMRRRHGAAAPHRRPQLRRSGVAAAAGFEYEGIGLGDDVPAPVAVYPSMTPARAIPRQAVILVGGEGTRARRAAPVVAPFVAYILDNLAQHGRARKAIFSTGFLAEAIEAVIVMGPGTGSRSATIETEPSLKICGAIANCGSR